MNPIEDTFTAIYHKGMWGKQQGKAFFSGSGSHDPHIVDPYIQMVSTFLAFFRIINDRKPVVVDLGCGDFAVGRRLLPMTERYIGLDVVKDLVEHNKSEFVHPGLEFHHHDGSSTPIPECDICFIRQVFQHLPNAAISASLDNVLTNCTYLLLTEHLPADPMFVPNLEIPNTGSWRLAINSGIDITAAPFRKVFRQSLPLVEVPEYGGLIRTMLYKV